MADLNPRQNVVSTAQVGRMEEKTYLVNTRTTMMKISLVIDHSQTDILDFYIEYTIPAAKLRKDFISISFN